MSFWSGLAKAAVGIAGSIFGGEDDDQRTAGGDQGGGFMVPFKRNPTNIEPPYRGDVAKAETTQMADFIQQDPWEQTREWARLLKKKKSTNGRDDDAS